MAQLCLRPFLVDDNECKTNKPAGIAMATIRWVPLFWGSVSILFDILKAASDCIRQE